MTVRRGRAPRPRPGSELRIGDLSRFDLGRVARTGAPEIVLAEGKPPEVLVAMLEELHAAGRGVLVSRLSAAHRRALARARAGGLPIETLPSGRIARLDGEFEPPAARGPVALLTAGTSDRSVADETREVLVALGVEVLPAYDVGVAGLHRLLRALPGIERRHPRLYLVFAGREGALPTVVAGLVRAPVLGIPTSQGYGRGGRGEAALNAMLQSCAPIAVVNIDAGVPAALFAVQLMRATPGAPRG